MAASSAASATCESTHMRANQASALLMLNHQAQASRSRKCPAAAKVSQTTVFQAIMGA